jgi:hypothetical protein
LLPKSTPLIVKNLFYEKIFEPILSLAIPLPKEAHAPTLYGMHVKDTFLSEIKGKIKLPY